MIAVANRSTASRVGQTEWPISGGAPEGWRSFCVGKEPKSLLNIGFLWLAPWAQLEWLFYRVLIATLVAIARTRSGQYGLLHPI